MSTNENSKKILTLCEKYWATYQQDCSGYIKAIASELKIPLSGQANDIVDQIQRDPWRILKSGVEACLQATSGMFVVAGLKANPHGHVVVVVPGPLSHSKYPTAYWGSLGGIAKKNTTINWSWNKIDRDNVIYACRSLVK
ncbi:hypothetical protein [Aliikangiella sp. IMCC44359]|uniref:hypothetical protein n=1 Tax=Aliikangiella sp. IMCC44359 TaxID=3459125 RepID=UPI00403AF6B7